MKTLIFITLLTAAFSTWIWQEYKSTKEASYTVVEREQMTALIASAEYELRKEDILAGVEPLTIGDLR